ncbi:sigma 54-interacting transcriptional regulator [Myxococcota bacterium]|nr:sigma 54-interacting transcriptional regulator [Myxococcota bacterium]
MSGPKTTMGLPGLAVVTPRRRCVHVVRSPDPSAVGRRLELDGQTWRLGRDVEGPGRIEDTCLSREHVCIAPGAAPGSYTIEDTRSRNGVFVNGVRLTRVMTVLPNMVVSIGETLLIVDQAPDPDLLPAAEGVGGDDVVECVGPSLGSERLRRAIATAARAEGAVLLLGPTGAGKEVAAQALHRLSPRSGGPWVPVNCAAIAPELAEDYFFGHKRGAFSGADRDRAGFFAEASGGTLFLDEIGELPMPMQAKLLRVLQDGSIRPIGATSDQRVDVRIIAATHADLGSTTFRSDLFARLGDWILHVPSLAARRADILALWSHFLAQDGVGRPTSAELDEALLLHAWPMNVRELQKLTRRVATLAGTAPRFELAHLPASMQEPVRARSAAPETEPEPAAVDALDGDVGDDAEVEVPSREVLEVALRMSRGKVSEVARKNGWHRTQVYRWAAKYALDVTKFR